MEALYSKLYDKYTRLKADKNSEIEQYNFDQEQKFKNYVSAADELIGYLKTEKDTLDAQVIELRHELVAERSAKYEEQEKYEDIILKDNQKIKELSEEIERLNRRESHSNTTSNEMVLIKKVLSSPVSSGKSKTMRKRRRNSIDEHEDSLLEKEAQNALEKENTSLSATVDDTNQPKCCRRRVGNSVNDASEPSICMFQELVESLLDLKFSVATQSGDTLMTAVHDSSGYSFNLGWMKNEEGEEVLMYKVSSLGTFERVAPEWMREVMLFSKSMSRIFFKKLSAIINRHLL